MLAKEMNQNAREREKANVIGAGKEEENSLTWTDIDRVGRLVRFGSDQTSDHLFGSGSMRSLARYWKTTWLIAIQYDFGLFVFHFISI